MKLTTNFSVAELTYSNTAVTNKLDNTPSSSILKNLLDLAENVLQPVRDNFAKSVIVNSGYRSTAVNSAANGAKNSDHCFGKAADIEIVGVSNLELAEWIIDNCEFKQVILEFHNSDDNNSGWVHVSYDINDNKKEVLSAVKVNNRTTYQRGLVLNT